MQVGEISGRPEAGKETREKQTGSKNPEARWRSLALS